MRQSVCAVCKANNSKDIVDVFKCPKDDSFHVLVDCFSRQLSFMCRVVSYVCMQWDGVHSLKVLSVMSRWYKNC